MVHGVLYFEKSVTTIGASAGATALVGYFPDLVSAPLKRLHLDKPFTVEDLDALDA